MGEELPKLPLNTALENLLEILRIEEEGENSTEALQFALDTAHGLLADSVDRRLAFVNILTGKDSFRPKEMGGLIGQAKLKVEQWKNRVKVLENILGRIELLTAEIVATSPVPIRGSEHELTLQNGPPALRTMFNRDERIFRNIVSRELVDFHNVPAKFLVESTITMLLADEVKKALQDGEKFPWAHLETKKHLRMRLK